MYSVNKTTDLSGLTAFRRSTQRASDASCRTSKVTPLTQNGIRGLAYMAHGQWLWQAPQDSREWQQGRGSGGGGKGTAAEAEAVERFCFCTVIVDYQTTNRGDSLSLEAWLAANGKSTIGSRVQTRLLPPPAELPAPGHRSGATTGTWPLSRAESKMHLFLFEIFIPVAIGPNYIGVEIPHAASIAPSQPPYIPPSEGFSQALVPQKAPSGRSAHTMIFWLRQWSSPADFPAVTRSCRWHVLGFDDDDDDDPIPRSFPPATGACAGRWATHLTWEGVRTRRRATLEALAAAVPRGACTYALRKYRTVASISVVVVVVVQRRAD
ncbi:hypothetical protein BGY98DRAFT_1179911 [Russula aff. rugulosa BPL654]|nr:hypothetical protein BGY98DRAFT_1179911 [Russula aff. rugulosa BPL654]